MWCPDGYVTVEDVYHRLADAISSSFDIMGQFSEACGLPGPDLSVAGDAASESARDVAWPSIRDNLTAKEIFPDWAIWNLLRSYDLDAFICSPQGTVLKAAKSLFHGSGVLGFDEFELPLGEYGDLSDLVEDIYNLEKEGVYSDWILDDGFFVDPSTWTIRSPANVRAFTLRDADRRARKSYRDFVILQDAAVRAGSGDLVKKFVWLPDEVGGTEWDEIAGEALALANVSGWSICFRESDIPANPEKLLMMTGVNLNSDAKGDNMNQSPLEIAEQIVMLHRSGVPIIRDAIKKKLARGMKTEQWRATWKIATEMCPELSKRGPKSGSKGL